MSLFYGKPGSGAWMTNKLRENELGKAYGLSSGKLNAWDLPEFDAERQNMLAERDIGLSNYSRNLTRSGVEGPAAALALEKGASGYSNNLLNLANKLRGTYTDRGLAIGRDVMNDKWKALATYMNWKQTHDAGKGGGSSIEGIVKALLEGMQSMGGGGGGGGQESGLTGGGSGVAGVGSSGSFGDWTGGYAFADGGVIEEPVIGEGVYSGEPYAFGEAGEQEIVLPTNLPQEYYYDEQPPQNQSGLNLPDPYANYDPNRKSQGYRGGYGITKGISGIAKLIASYYMGSPGLAISGAKDIGSGVSTAMED